MLIFLQCLETLCNVILLDYIRLMSLYFCLIQGHFFITAAIWKLTKCPTLRAILYISPNPLVNKVGCLTPSDPSS